MKRSLNEVIDLDFASKQGPVLKRDGLFVLGKLNDLAICDVKSVTNCDLKWQNDLN